jgi:hypothetical protein
MAEPEVNKPDDVPEAVKETEKPLKVNMVMSHEDRLLLDRIGSYLLLTSVTRDRHCNTVCKRLVRSYNGNKWIINER